MSLNHIQLTDFTVAEWYKKDALLPLAQSPAPTPPAPATATAPPATHTPTTPPQSAPPISAIPPPATTAPSPSIPKAPAREVPTTASPAPPVREAPKATPQTPEPPQALARGPESPAPTYKSLGNNRRHITLLVHSPGTPFLPDNQLAFLTKILEACRMTLADVAIVNNAAAPVTIAELRQQLQPRTVLLFGVDPTTIRVPINFPHFKQLNYDDCMYLSSPALDQLVPNTEDSKLLKSKLWVSLKTLFDV